MHRIAEVLRRALKSAVSATCILAAMAVSCAALGQSLSPSLVQIGEPLPDAPLRGLNGSSRHFADFRGKPLIINVWASWCGPCQAEMASLERLAWLEATGRFNIIGISTDDSPDRAQALLLRSNATISHFIDSALYLETLLGASRLPLTVLVGADGRVVEKIYGARQWDDSESLLLIGKLFKISWR